MDGPVSIITEIWEEVITVIVIQEMSYIDERSSLGNKWLICDCMKNEGVY